MNLLLLVVVVVALFSQVACFLCVCVCVCYHRVMNPLHPRTGARNETARGTGTGPGEVQAQVQVQGIALSVPNWLQDSCLFDRLQRDAAAHERTRSSTSTSISTRTSTDTVTTSSASVKFLRKNARVAELTDFIEVMSCIDHWRVHDWTRLSQIWRFVSRDIAAVREWRDGRGSSLAIAQDVNFCDEILESLTRGCDVMFVSCRLGSVAWLKYAVGCGISVHVQDNKGLTGLHHASGRGRLDVMRVLLHLGSEVNFDADTSGFTSKCPVHMAAKNGHLAAVKLLHENGAKLEYSDRNTYAATPVEVACRHGHVDVVRWLHSQGCDISRCEEHGETLMGGVVRAGDLAMLEVLAELNGGHPQCGDYNGRQLWQIAIQCDQQDMLRLCSRLFGHDYINLHTIDRFSGIEFAVANDEVSDIVNKGNISMIRLLHDLGTNVNKADELLAFRYFQTHFFGTTSPPENIQRNKRFIDQYSRYITPFEYACALNKLEIVRQLAEFGALEMKADATTALVCACHFGHVSILMLLLGELGVDINYTNEVCDNMTGLNVIIVYFLSLLL